MGSIVITLLQFQFDKRHSQVEAGIIVNFIGFEHERHGIAPAQDLAAYRYSLAVCRTPVRSKKNGVSISYRSAIDAQRVITTTFRSHATRQLQYIASWRIQHKRVPIVATVVSILAALVVNLERLERFRDFIRHVVLIEHIHVMGSIIITLNQFILDHIHRQIQSPTCARAIRNKLEGQTAILTDKRTI